ncbi:hypothetical protein [Asticcacaulis solisilvae]|uniref:hypothetical protein n=1 Tax=Asticcacaulis solisilvae TaxID=1217274 RepID=UPI003FD8E2C8
MRRAALSCLILLGACAPVARTPPSAELYARFAMVSRPVVAPGALMLGDRAMQCGPARTVMDAGLRDYGAAIGDFIVLNPDRLAGAPAVAQQWVYAHECGHLNGQTDEEAADCFGVRKGRDEGWLDAGGLDAVCAFVARVPPDHAHAPGADRCAAMRRCFASSAP